MTVFESRDITKKFAEFEGNANTMLYLVINYMKPFEMILLFVRSTGHRYLQRHMEMFRVSYKVFLRAWSSNLCPFGTSVHYNDAGNWKKTPIPWYLSS